MNKKRRLLLYILALLIVMSSVYYIWTGKLLGMADTEFRQYVKSSADLFSPEMLEEVDRAVLDSKISGRVQFLTNPWRKEITLDYVHPHLNGTVDYLSSLGGGLRATRSADGRWTLQELRAFGPS